MRFGDYDKKFMKRVDAPLELTEQKALPNSKSGSIKIGIRARAKYVRLFELFWGEQPPFTSFGRGGRYFFALMT